MVVSHAAAWGCAATGDAQWQQRVASRLQQLRCVGQAVERYGGRTAISAGEAEQDPLLHAMAGTKKHLDFLDNELVRVEEDLARTRHKLQVTAIRCCYMASREKVFLHATCDYGTLVTCQSWSCRYRSSSWACKAVHGSYSHISCLA